MEIESNHVLGRGHGSRIDVHIGIDLDRGDSGTLSLQQQSGTRGWRKLDRAAFFF